MGKLTINSSVFLSNRVEMPLFGYGAAEINPWTDEQTEIVGYAIDTGVRLLDTAYGYQTERGVGQAVRQSGILREEFFITSKMPASVIRNGEKAMVRCFEETLRRLGTEYLDLYLIHWPAQGKTMDAWRVLERLYYTGRVRAIGMSNLNRRHWLDIMAKCDVMPHVQQDEFHPYRMNEYLRIFDERYKIHFEAFMPVVRGMLKEDTTLLNLAEKYGKSTFQILLRWDIQHGVTTIPRSADEKHIRSNADIFNFEISDDDMKIIDSLNVERTMNRDIDNFNF